MRVVIQFFPSRFLLCRYIALILNILLSVLSKLMIKNILLEYSRTKFGSLILALLLTLSACATLPANTGQTSFSGYAEAVFRHQNELGSRLMMLNDADQLPDTDEFDKTEQAMTDACHLLNEYAERENSGDNIGISFKTKVQASVEGCDLSVKKMEALLTRVGIGK